MRSLVAALLGLGLLALSGCADDNGGGHRGGCHRGGGSAEGEGCGQGVSFSLGDVASRFGGKLPVTVTACFDSDCDELTVVRSSSLVCDGAPGGPASQLTWCDFAPDGTLSIDIERVDGAKYDGSKHTAAVSIRDQSGELLYSQARSVTIDGCGLLVVDATR